MAELKIMFKVFYKKYTEHGNLVEQKYKILQHYPTEQEVKDIYLELHTNTPLNYSNVEMSVEKLFKVIENE